MLRQLNRPIASPPANPAPMAQATSPSSERLNTNRLGRRYGYRGTAASPPSQRRALASPSISEILFVIPHPLSVASEDLLRG